MTLCPRLRNSAAAIPRRSARWIWPAGYATSVSPLTAGYILCELIYDSPNAKLALIQRIKPLLAYDEEHNTQLLYTLETYFNNCQNSVKTSKALFIHRNTLLYRLDRIAEILDLNYNDSEQMLTFQLALKAFLMCQ